MVVLLSGACALSVPDTLPPTGGARVVRVATWNVERLGAPGDADYEAVLAVLARIDADLVSLNELDSGENEAFFALADALGYPEALTAEDNPFGTLHNGMMTRLPLDEGALWTSEVLSGDDLANDLTRLPVTMRVRVGGASLTVAGNHLKSGDTDPDAFRRAVEAIRTADAAAAASAGPFVVCGDWNAELADVHAEDGWNAVPVEVPASFRLGEDLANLLAGEGLADDPFAPLLALDLVRAEARQPDGDDATRDESGRVIDHLFASSALEVVGAEIYDARDDELSPLTLSGAPPTPEATALAADHFPVFADLRVRW